MTADITYFVDGYIDPTYYVYTAEADAELTSTSTLTANGSLTYEINYTQNYTQTSAVISSNISIYGTSSVSNILGTIIPPTNISLVDSDLRTYISITGNFNG